MQQINNLTDQADQLTSAVLQDGSLLQLEFIYRGSIQRWSLNAAHPSLPGGAVLNLTLVVHPNMMRSWRNLIPFGLAVTSADGLDPYNIEDFVQNGNLPIPRINVYVLIPTEVSQVELIYLSPPSVYSAAAS